MKLAPTFASALSYLGMLELEAGRVEVGTQRIALALRIDPHEGWVRVALARFHALEGNYARAEATIDLLISTDPRFVLAATAMRPSRTVM